VSTDYGTTWAVKGSIAAWSSVAMSADGTKMTAVVSSGQIYTSTTEKSNFQGNVGIGATTTPSANLSIAGSAGQTTPLFAISTSTAAYATTTAFIINSNGYIGIGKANPAYPIDTIFNSARLDTGGSWTNGSSRAFKENFTKLDKTDILNKINNLDITKWNYKVEGPSITHIGPIAEDFFNQFGLGGSNTTISTIDPAGIALIGVQALTQQVNDLKSMIASTTSVNSNPETILSFLESLGTKITSGIAYFKDVVVERLTIGSETKPSSITVFDKGGKEGCMTVDAGVFNINSGVLKVNPGACDQTPPQTNITTSTPPEIPPDVSSTTVPEISPDISSTTPPNTEPVTTTGDQIASSTIGG
jgi:hypothetical protein